MYGLLHSNADWFFSGIIVFIGIMVFLIKIAHGHIISTIASGIVWVFVYKLHSGSTAGIMTATFAALLFDTFGTFIISMFTRSKE